MPGTLVTDANEPNLLAGATLNAAGTTNGTVVELNKPHEVQFQLATGTVTGTSMTISVVIQGSDDVTFSTGVIDYGRVALLSGNAAAQSNVTRGLTTFVDRRYYRAVVTVAGTSPVYTGSTLRVRQPHHLRTAGSFPNANN